MNEQIVKIHRTCPFCGQPNTIDMPRDAVEKMNAGAFIQEAWPQGSASDREGVISGAHGACYDAAYPEEEASADATYIPPTDPQPQDD